MFHGHNRRHTVPDRKVQRVSSQPCSSEPIRENAWAHTNVASEAVVEVLHPVILLPRPFKGPQRVFLFRDHIGITRRWRDPN